MQLNKPSKKKLFFPINEQLRGYLKRYNRAVELPLQYEDLLEHSNAIPLFDLNGEDTLWETVFYDKLKEEEIHTALKGIYALLKTDGDIEVMEHLTIARIDYCTFGNSKPFRIRIINGLNDNYDHFYVKRGDASRVYGLELEELLSPNSLRYLVKGGTLVEQHIAGIPGDLFIDHHLDESEFNQIRIAKEFVKFNERCFIRLLGDMRSYNFVVDITPDIEASQYRIRAIDFDQQSYEGWKSFYMPQYFKDNNGIIDLGIKHMGIETVRQYQMEERSLVATRVKSSINRLRRLFDVMNKDIISTEDKVIKLRKDLGEHHKTKAFDNCRSMGEIVETNIRLLLAKDFKQSFG